MTRIEEIEKAAREYNDDDDDLQKYEAFKSGAKWADTYPIHYDGKAYLYVLIKGVEQGKKEMLDKVCKWIERNGNYYIGFTQGQPCITDDFIENLKKCLKE